MDRSEERRIIEKVLKGDTNAFEAIVSEHERLVYNIALKMLQSPEDAQDAVQETFIKAYQSLGAFRGESKLSVWLYRLASNVCIDMLRKRRVQTVSLSAEDEDGGEQALELPDERFSPEAELEKKELRRAVREGLGELGDDYRQVLVMREVAGLSYNEIAEATRLDLGTVKSRIFRARKKLCTILVSGGNISHPGSSKETKGGEQA
jgi:RNA polymerase sigma factor (sigma-70 family)